MEYTPPVLARLFLRLILPRDLHTAVAGDLEERFQRDAAVDPAAARRSYWRDALSPSLLRLRRESRGMPLPPGAPPGSGPGDGPVRSLMSDLRFAVRSLRKAPGFTAVAVLSLALGIGPNTAIFSIVDTILFQEWGVGEPEGLVDIYTLTDQGEYFFSRFSNYELVRDGSEGVFEAVAHHSLFSGRIDDPSGETELILGEIVTGNYFDVMRVTPALGRAFLPEEDATEGTHPVVVLGHDYWASRHAADPSVVGSEIRLNGRPYTVVGVAPESFRGRIAPGVGTDFWVPVSMYTHLDPIKLNRGDLTISGRVAPGVPTAQAISAVETIGARRDQELRAENPDQRSRFRLAGVSLADVRIHPNFDGRISQFALLLFVAVGLVLLVACVNLAGFLLSRASERRKEMAVRVAMGAGRLAIIRQLIVESLVLAGLGAVGGLVLGLLAARTLASIEPPIPIPLELEVGLSIPLLLFTAGTALVAALVFGLTPALESTRAPVAATLRDEAGSSSGRGKVGARGALVVGQMALSTMLLFGAALFVRSLQAATDLDLGFDTREAAVVTLDASPAEYSEDEAAAFNDELLRRLEALPAITSVARTNRMPLTVGNTTTSFDIPGVEPPPNQNRHSIQLTRVTDAYFETMGMQLFEGRSFDDTDVPDGPRTAVLSQAAADQWWPGENAVGKVLLPDTSAASVITVVGVVDNAKMWSLGEPPLPFMYLSSNQATPPDSYTIVATGNASPPEIAGLIRQEIRALEPTVFLTEVGTMNDHLGYIFFLPRMAAVLMTLIGLLALSLACMGLYGMVSYNVSRRTREMGIRLALGADRQRVIRLVLQSGLAVIGIGAAIGIAGSLGMGSVLRSANVLHGIGGLDILSILAAPVLLGAIATLATYLPARAAARVDPVRALRSD